VQIPLIRKLLNLHHKLLNQLSFFPLNPGHPAVKARFSLFFASGSET